jgi:chromosome segregation ATPase
MSEFDDLLADLRQKRDELRVKINLASKEIKDEWEELEEKMEDLSGKAKQFAGEAGLKETGQGLGKAMGQLGQEIKLGYERIRKATRED